jgi:serine/threonine protein kinase/tetratricopeptide (TPR) repeat protein
MSPTSTYPSLLDVELDAWLESFEKAATQGSDPDPFDYLPDPSHPKYVKALRELLCVDLELAWSRGNERRVEEYLTRFPVLLTDRATLTAVAMEEFRQRCVVGESPDANEYRERFSVDLPVPGKSVLFPLAGESFWVGDRFPQVGEIIASTYRVVEELGRGAFGRVYLAEQSDLANRHVAIKISSRLIREAQTLARLQHTHIVPVYAVHRVGDYQVLVMPFLGRMTLFDAIAAKKEGRLTAKSVQTIAGRTLPGTSDENARAERAASTRPPVVLAAATEAGVVEIGIRIADALAHAHGRGILHRDVKPANVLLTDDGVPMLLDFNLATDGTGTPASAGGTPRYMSPEQIRALKDPKCAIDQRTDGFSLGVVLHELLLGGPPFPDRSGTWAEIAPAMLSDRQATPNILYQSPSLAAVLRKCLQFEPGLRYASAADLRDDLSRHRDHLPLRFAREPWSIERTRKWARRHPRLTSATSVALVAAVVLCCVAGATYFLWKGNRQLHAREAHSDVRQTREQVRLLVADPNGPHVQFQNARQQSLESLANYDLPANADWVNHRNVRGLSSDEAVSLRTDIAVLLAYGAEATGQLALRESNPAARDALFDEALLLNFRGCESYPSTEPIDLFVKQRIWLLEQSGRTDQAKRATKELVRAVSAPRVALYLGAMTAMRENRFSDAANDLEKLTSSTPPNHAVWMELGIARLRMHQYESACEAFLAASAIEPSTVWPRFYRGVALLSNGRFEQAIQQFDAFIERDPQVADAYLNRALAWYRKGNTAESLSDLNQAEKLHGPSVRLHSLRCLAYQRSGNLKNAESERRKLLSCAPRDADDWTIRAEARFIGDPAGALEDFDQALQVDPDAPQALRGKGSVLSERLNKPAEAVKVLEKLLAGGAATIEDRAGYSVLLARLGHADSARTEARKCLEVGSPAIPLYQAASALAITARSAAERAESVVALRRVIQVDASLAQQMPDDPDLVNIRSEPEFIALMEAARVISGPGR